MNAATATNLASNRWQEFWFSERYPHSLCLVRLFFGLALVLRLTGCSGLFDVGSLSMRFPFRFWPVSKMFDAWHMPYFSWLPLPSPFWFARLEEALLVLSIFFMLGLFTRWGAPLLAGLFSYVFLLSQWNHHHHLLVFVVVLWILAFSPCSQFYSLDSLVRSPLARARKHPVTAIRLLQVLVTAIYLFAFVWKCHSGWLTGRMMEILHQTENLRGPLAAWTIDHLGYQFLSVSTLLVEGLLPLCLWVPQLRRPAIALGIMLHLGIDSMMDVATYSYQMMTLYIAFIYPESRATVVLYDGQCGMCRSSRRWAALLDWFARVQWLNFRDPRVRELVPLLTDEQMEREMQVIRPDGSILTGFAGWRFLLNSFPLTFLPSWLLYLPGVSWIGERAYRFVAIRRSLSCEVPRPEPTHDDVWQRTLRRAKSARAT